MSLKSLEKANAKGVVKRKHVFGKHSISTRYRSKLEQVRKVMKALRLDEKHSEVLERSVLKDTKCLRVHLRDLQDHSPKSNEEPFTPPVQHYCEFPLTGKYRKSFNNGKRVTTPQFKSCTLIRKSELQQESFHCPEELQSECRNSLTQCADFDDKRPANCKSDEAYTLLHKPRDLEKGKCHSIEKSNECYHTQNTKDTDMETKETKTRNLKSKDHLQMFLSELCPCSEDKPWTESEHKDHCLFSSPEVHLYKMLPLSTSEELQGSEFQDQGSLSPPNSPLYDMPPPSTPAQKKARQAKRILQLERWRKSEASRSRQERYERRTQQQVKINQSGISGSKRVQWSANLVQTLYFSTLTRQLNSSNLEQF